MFNSDIVLLSLSNVLTTRTAYGALCYKYFFFLLIYLEVVILELYETQNKILLI